MVTGGWAQWLVLLRVFPIVIFVFFLGCAPEPPKQSAAPSPAVKTVVIENKLEGIIYSETNPIAIIGGNNYDLGDTIGGYTVTKITSEAITLLAGDEEKEYRVGDVVAKKTVAVPSGTAALPPKKAVTHSRPASPASSSYGAAQFDIAFKYYHDAQNYFNTAESYMQYAQDKKMRYASMSLESKVGYSSIINRARNEYAGAQEYYQKALTAAQSSREGERLSEDQNRQMLYIIDKAREKSMLAETEQAECARMTEDRVPGYKGEGA